MSDKVSPQVRPSRSISPEADSLLNGIRRTRAKSRPSTTSRTFRTGSPLDLVLYSHSAMSHRAGDRRRAVAAALPVRCPMSSFVWAVAQECSAPAPPRRPGKARRGRAPAPSPIARAQHEHMVGGRFLWLRCSSPLSWPQQSEAGLGWDLGYGFSLFTAPRNSTIAAPYSWRTLNCCLSATNVCPTVGMSAAKNSGSR